MIYPIFPTANGSAVEERVAVFTNFRGLWLSNRLFPLLLFHTTQMGLSKCDLLPNLPESLLFKTDCDMSLSFSESSQLVSGEHKQVPGRLEISCLGSCTVKSCVLSHTGFILGERSIVIISTYSSESTLGALELQTSSIGRSY